MRILNLPAGIRFGKLTVVERSGSNRGGQAMYLCKCDCGEEVTRPGTDLKRGNSVQCGRCASAQAGRHSRKHGESLKSGKCSPEYKSWCGMINRCESTAAINYHNYGGRGIRVYPPWREDFRVFLAYIGRKPTPTHSLDRYPDPNGNYEPGNVRWATREEQAQNRRNTRLLTVEGETRTLTEWSKISGIPYGCILQRLEAGWDHYSAVKTARRILRGKGAV